MDIYDNKSSLETILCGVPQGSILGPLLFLIYVNDINNASNLNIMSFADDTTITASSPKIDILYANMNTELVKLENWFRANKLCLNIKKTKYILFRPNAAFPKRNENYISLNGQIGNNFNEKSFKFLGVYVDETLSWRYHIDSVCAKIARSNYMINKVKNILPKSALHTLYSAI